MFDEVRFPEEISYGASGGPGWLTNVSTIFSGREQRNQNWVVPRHRWNVATGIKRIEHYHEVLGFFFARRGRLRGFRYKDWADFTSAASPAVPISPIDQVIGTGAGPHQLVKLYADAANPWTRTIRKPVAGTALISVGGAPYSSTDPTYGWSVNTTTGVVAFNNPAAPGLSAATIRAGFEFDVPARFDVDQLDGVYDNPLSVIAQSIDIIEIRI